jgi:transcriptional regulator with XRE-family HTH domain
MSQMSAKSDLAWDLRDRLHKSLRISGLTATAMSVKLELHRNTINNYLSGKTPIDHRTLVAWADAAGVPLVWLEDGVEVPTPPDGDGVVSELPQQPDREAALARLAAKKRRHAAGGDNHRYAA